MIQQEVEILRDLEDLDSITKTIQTRYKNGWIVSAMTSLPWNRDVVITFIKIKDYSPGSLLEIRLYTGRTHQIRAHLSHIGHPLLGDGKYGVNRDDRKQGYKYQALYSYKTVFAFERKGETLDYLAGKEFSVDENDIWFCKELFGADRKRDSGETRFDQ